MPMISIEDILKIPDAFNVIPIVQEINGDMDTPMSIFSSFHEESYAFFFESTEGVGKWGRYSFICLNPFLTVSLSKNILNVSDFGHFKSGLSNNIDINDLDEDIFSYLKGVLSNFKLYEKNLPKTFTGGLFGYLSYEMSGLIEKLPPLKSDITGVYDLFFMLPQDMIIFDAITQVITVVSFLFRGNSGQDNIEDKYKSSLDRINRLTTLIRKRSLKATSVHKNHSSVKIIDEIDFPEYKQKVLKAKEYILQGDIFQVQISRRKKILNPPRPFSFYRALRLINPSPYMFYLKINDFSVIGSSPENLVKLEGNFIETRPIAGTIKRGEDVVEDEYLGSKLLNDPKERAEHIMLVDLGRNDIGRVSKKGSVKVEKLMYIEKYSHVQHIVTGIISEIEQDNDGFDLIRATYPAGTVTGAPKVRAMEIINELEDSKRGVYAGGVGYFGFLEDNRCKKMEFCITIRTALFKEDAAYIQAAGGIVYDSTPENEFMETESKLKPLIEAFNLADNFD